MCSAVKRSGGKSCCSRRRCSRRTLPPLPSRRSPFGMEGWYSRILPSRAAGADDPEPAGHPDRAFSSESPGLARVAVSARYRRPRPASDFRKEQPDLRSVETSVRGLAQNVSLLPLGAYAAKYLGYELTAGAFSMEVACLIQNRKLSLVNTISIDGLTLGFAGQASREATKLPVRLAISRSHGCEGKDHPARSDFVRAGQSQGRFSKSGHRRVDSSSCQDRGLPVCRDGRPVGGWGRRARIPGFHSRKRGPHSTGNRKAGYHSSGHAAVAGDSARYRGLGGPAE